jgi:hypothetical protein
MLDVQAPRQRANTRVDVGLAIRRSRNGDAMLSKTRSDG